MVALGCRVGRSDAEALLAGLGAGYRAASPGERADWVVVSACTVTGDAASSSRQAIRRAARDHPGARILVAGCHAPGEAAALRGLPAVAAVVGATAHAALPSLVEALDAGEDPEGALRRATAASPAWTAPPPASTGPARPALKVQDGCDRRCSYCAVWAARGRSRSLPRDEALRRLAALGTRRPEVVLTGVHLGAYGRDLAPASSLESLVEEVVRRRAVRRLRFSSVDPLELPLGLLDGEAGSVLCRHLHLPLQSLSDAVLRAMRRPGCARDLSRAVESAARAWPRACLGADVLVGFPGESEEDHRLTVARLRSLPVSYLHVFPFSPRPGTDAAGMPGRVPPAEVEQRAAELRALSAERWRAFLSSLAGLELEVVVERATADGAEGTSSEFAPVRLDRGGLSRGDLVRVRVDGASGGACTGAVAGVERLGRVLREGSP